MGYFGMKGSKANKCSSATRDEEVEEALVTIRSEATAAVPKGCMAVYVGEERRRFVIPANYVCLPVFRPLMERVAEEFGFEQSGGLRIPCEEEDFVELLVALRRSGAAKKIKKKKKKKKNSMKMMTIM